MSLADALERAAAEFPDCAHAIRPANGDPVSLLARLDTDAAARVLTWLLQYEDAAAEALVLAWAEGPDGAAPLSKVREHGLPKSSRKLLRRALHRLRSRGVALPAVSPPEPVVARLPALDDPLERAFVFAPDPSGSQIAYWVEPDPAGGARLFEILLDDMRGVLDFEVYSAGRSRVREFLQVATKRPGHPARPAPVAAVRARLAWVAARQPHDRPLPSALVEWRGRLVPDSVDLTPGELAREALGDDASEELIARAVALLKEGRLGPWPPAEDWLAESAKRLEAAIESPIVVSGARRRERVRAELEEIAAGLYVGDFLAATVARFRESAYVLWKGQDLGEARACLAVARALAEDPLAASPVTRALLERLFEPLLRGLRDENNEEDGPSLLIQP